MSARDELFEALMPWSGRPAPGEEESINALIDDFAHELAEKLREYVGPPSYPHESDWVTRYIAGWLAAADEIDPDVST